MLRRTAIPVLCLALIAAMAWTAVWGYLAWRLPDRIAAEAEALRRQGHDVRWDDLAVGGYPDRLVATMTGVVLEPTAQAFGARAPVLELRMAVLDWTRIEGRFPDGVVAGGPTVALSAESGEVFATLPAGRGTLVLDGALETVTADGPALPGPASARRLTLRGERPLAGALDHAEAALTATLALSDLALPRGAGGPMGDRIQELALALRLMGEIPPAPLPDALVLWRDDGGTLEIDRLDLAWGPVTLAAEGTMSLDRAMQPEGAMTAEIGGYEAALRALVAAGTVSARDAAGAGLAFALLARRPADGGPPVLRVPLSIQDRLLRVGPIPLLPVPFVTWR